MGDADGLVFIVFDHTYYIDVEHFKINVRINISSCVFLFFGVIVVLCNTSD